MKRNYMWYQANGRKAITEKKRREMIAIEKRSKGEETQQRGIEGGGGLKEV